MTKFQDLNLSNAFLFAATAQDPEACRTILQIVLGKDIPQRSRYHHAEMDVSTLKPGMDFRQMKPVPFILVRKGKADRVKLLHEKVKQVKKNAELEGRYMTGEDLLRWSKEDGKAEGKAESILIVLSSKFPVPEDLREKILCQGDVSVLDEWIVLAANAESIEDFVSKSAI